MWMRTLEIGATYIYFISGAKDKAMINLVCYAKLCFWTAERGICQWSALYKNVIPLFFWSSNLSSLYLFPRGRISQQMEGLHIALFLKLLFFTIFFSLNARRRFLLQMGSWTVVSFISSNYTKVLVFFLMKDISKLALSDAVHWSYLSSHSLSLSPPLFSNHCSFILKSASFSLLCEVVCHMPRTVVELSGSQRRRKKIKIKRNMRK